jgi:hypothetical protein
MAPVQSDLGGFGWPHLVFLSAAPAMHPLSLPTLAPTTEPPVDAYR